MQQIKKIMLFPTHRMQSYAPKAVGSVNYDDTAGQISVNLFNLPEPTKVLDPVGESATYKGWLFHPGTGEVLQIGTLIPGGENFYFLYDAPFLRKDGFREIIITAETRDHADTADGDILLIGYLAQENAQAMEPFEPFDPPLLDHKWWKIRCSVPYSARSHAGTPSAPSPFAVMPQVATTPYAISPNRATATHSYSTGLPCDHCPQRQQNTPPSHPPAPLTDLRRDGFDLPNLIGMVTDDSRKLQYMVHGIPGRLLRSDQPDQGRTGYLYWHPYYGMEEQPGAVGYWLCYIDPMTNQFLTPMGVTIPPG